MYRIELESNAAEVLQQLQQFPQRVNRAIMRALDYENELTVSQIIEKRLSFPHTKRIGGMKVTQPTVPDGLRVVTGRLRRSIRRSQAVLTPDGVESSIGSNVAYAGVHEYGYTGPVGVGAHQRITKKGAAVQVRAHTRNVKLPARRFIQRTIEERLPNYTRTISREIVEEWNRPQGGQA